MWNWLKLGPDHPIFISMFFFFIVYNLWFFIWFSKNRSSGPILSISRNISVFVCPSYFLTLFNSLFAPTFQSPTSKLFRFSESLGKSNDKKWSQIWKLLLIKGVTLLRQKSFFLLLYLFTPFKHLFFPPLLEVQYPNFLGFQNPWGKIMKRSGCRFQNFFL